MTANIEVVITGVGVVSPIGTGREAFWDALRRGQNGIGPITSFDARGLPVRIAAEVQGFDPKLFIRPLKSLKVMSRDAQFGMAAASLAYKDAQLASQSVDPDRFGVVLGADTILMTIEEVAEAYRPCVSDGEFNFDLWGTRGLERSFPLGMLRLLPNMVPAHISIAHDARGPNNTIYQGDISGLLAIGEAVRVIQRGQADVMLAGAASSRMHPFDWVRTCLCEPLSRRNATPEAASRPFDAGRDGLVRGEGGAVLVLERRSHAESRGAAVLARIAGWSSAYGSPSATNGSSYAGLGRAVSAALSEAGMKAGDVGHVNANGLSTPLHDRLEAEALHASLEGVPVVALKGHFGNLGAASGAVELAASVLSIRHNLVPATRNYERPDRDCPVHVINSSGLVGAKPTAISVNLTKTGQAAAMVVAAP